MVSFLVWLVELYQVSEAFNVSEALYPDVDDDDMEINDYDFKVNCNIFNLFMNPSFIGGRM